MMENEKIIKSDGEQISQTNNDAGSVISRRQFSLGVSGIVFAGTTLESLERNTLAAKASIVPTQPGPRKLTPHAFNQPQYILTKTVASIWSPDGRYIATFQENAVTLYNASTGTPELTYRQHTDEILTIQWSVDSKYLASSSFDQTVHVWDAMSGKTITVYKRHTNIVRELAWSPHQHYLASSSYDKTVQVWEALTGTTVVTYSGHAAEIYTLKWSPDGRRIASTDLQNRTMIWRVI